MKIYLDNLAKIAVNSNKIDHTQSDQDDETSVQETITYQRKKNGIFIYSSSIYLFNLHHRLLSLFYAFNYFN